jgi:signal transduction histidine kinase
VTLGVGVIGAVLMRREQKLAALREDFVSGVSHELRTPLTQIRVLSELLDSDGFRSDDERKRAVAVIHRESLRLSNLVDNILEFTRLRKTDALGGAAPIVLPELLQELADLLEPLVASRENRLDIADGTGLVVRGDADALRRVLRNLIENAVKYGPPSQTIRIAGARHGDRIRIAVDDEGPGIPPADRARVWQPYFRLDRDRNAPGGGTGLGLSVVADLVRRLDGTIMIEDAPTGGARFTLDLPAMS